MKPTLLLVTIASALLIILSSCGTSGTLTLDEVVRTPDERFIDIDGYRINYRDSGSPSGIADYPVILLYHGFGGNLANFDQVYPTLAREFRVIAFDRPPFGYSEKALKRDFADYDPYRPEAQAALGIRLLEELEIPSALLAGHSAGGLAAMLAADAFPNRVEGLLLISPAVLSGGGPPRAVTALFSLPLLREIGVGIARSVFGNSQALLDQAVYDSSAIDEATLEAYRRGSEVRNWDRALWQFTLSSRSVDGEELAARLSPRVGSGELPVYIITGDSDEIVDPQDSLALHLLLPGSLFSAIPATGHVAFQERPAEFLSLALPWLLKTGGVR
jgi:pimeloyl-ACP methyl ester carboxylesterase